MNSKIKNTVTTLSSIAVIMFCFGYVLVPIYDVFCDITGLNGKTGVISKNEANSLSFDINRSVTVEFDTNVNSKLPWKFHADTRKINVIPGKLVEVSFQVESLAANQTFGKAVPSVTPPKGSIYFNKTECFCFSEQDLGPGERKTMSVRFVVDPALPLDVKSLVLSYTFFAMEKNVTTRNKDLKINSNKI
jgi:cytochrome c oxidase assembly protein subunit 11